MSTDTTPPRLRLVSVSDDPRSSSMDRRGTRGREILASLPIETQTEIRTEVTKLIAKVRQRHALEGMSSYQAFALREECRREVESLITEWSV